MAEWWNVEHHVLSSEVAEMVVQRRVGGAILDRGVDGSESRWGTVLAYEPPRRFVFAWHVSPRWTIEPDIDKASEVHVRFGQIEAGRTLVSLSHRHLERHGDGWETMRDAVAAPESWPAASTRYAELVARA